LYLPVIYFYVFLYISEPVVKHSSGETDIEFENMDFLELTSSEELLLFEAVSNVARSQRLRAIEHLSCSRSTEGKKFGLLPGYTLNNCFIT
jgi:hypothetical protein